MTGKFLVLGVTLALSVLSYCGKESLNYSIEIVDGVNHVSNSGVTRKDTSPIRLELVRAIGDLDAEDGNYALFLPEDLTVDRNGNIYVLDAGNTRIQKFDSNGKYLLTIGREGKGPGELSYPTSINTNSEGNIVVADGNNSRFTVFSPDGKLVDTIRFERRIIDFRTLMDGRIVTKLYETMFSISGIEERDPSLMRVYDLDENLQFEMGSPEDFGDPATNGGANTFFFDTDNKGRFYLSFQYLNRVDMYSSEGAHLLQVKRSLNYKIVIEKTVVENFEGGGTWLRTGKKNEVSSGIAIDHKGRIWVATLTRQIGENEKAGMFITIMMNQSGITRQTSGNTELRTTDIYELEVFDSEGILLQRSPVEHFVDDMRIFGDSLFLLDKLRGMQFIQYRIMDRQEIVN